MSVVQPGFELERILEQLGIKPACSSFKEMIHQMNQLGLGCRQHVAWIVGELRVNAVRWGAKEIFGDTTTPTWITLRSNLLFRIDPLDPIPGLVEESIRRSEASGLDHGNVLIGEGVGTELMRLFKSLGVSPSSHCSCRKLARKMNDLGVEGCRQRVDWISNSIKKNYARWGWQEVFSNTTTAAWNLLRTGLIFKLDPLDPIPGLVNEAILLADKKADV